MRAPLTAFAWLTAACAVGPAPLAPEPRPTPPPATRASSAPAAPSALLVPVAAVPAPAVEHPAAPAAPTPPRVLLESPYSALGHPPLATEMLTLARDEELFQWALGGSSDPAHVSQQPNYHPATRVVIEVELRSRAPKGTTAKLTSIARSAGYWSLRSCFEAAQRLEVRRQRSVTVRLTLGAHGRVLGSRSLGRGAEPGYARCALERLRKLDFRPGFTRKLDVDIHVKQWAGHAPVPPRAPEAVPPLSLPGATLSALQDLRPTLSACYGHALERDPGLWGRLAFRLVLDDNGAVMDAVQVETRFPNEGVVACARQALIEARLPEPSVRELRVAFRLGQPAPPAPEAPASPEGAPPPPEAPALPEPPAPLPPAPSH